MTLRYPFLTEEKFSYNFHIIFKNELNIFQNAAIYFNILFRTLRQFLKMIPFYTIGQIKYF